MSRFGKNGSKHPLIAALRRRRLDCFPRVRLVQKAAKHTAGQGGHANSLPFTVSDEFLQKSQAPSTQELGPRAPIEPCSEKHPASLRQSQENLETSQEEEPRHGLSGFAKHRVGVDACFQTISVNLKAEIALPVNHAASSKDCRAISPCRMARVAGKCPEDDLVGEDTCDAAAFSDRAVPCSTPCCKHKKDAELPPRPFS